MFLTYQPSNFNNWEKWEILLYVFIILNGRFSFKLNFIPGWNSTRFITGWSLEAVVRRCSVRKVFWEMLQNSQDSQNSQNSRRRMQLYACKETLAKVFSCEFCRISKNTFFHRTPLVAAFWKLTGKQKCFHRGTSLIKGWDFISVTLNALWESEWWSYKNKILKFL